MKIGALPPSWVMTTLGEICERPQYGWTTKAVESGAIRLLRTTDITKGTIAWDAVPFCETIPPELNKYRLIDGDIVISRAGSVGASALVTGCEEAVFASYLIRFRVTEAIDRRYVAYLLKSPAFRSYIASQAAGIALQNVNARKLERFPVPLAPRKEQERIVAELDRRFSHLDSANRSLASTNGKLHLARTAILEGLVRGSLLGLDASEWKRGTTGEFAEVRGGIQKQPKRKPTRNRYPFLRVANVSRGALDLAEVHEVELFGDELQTYKLKRGDLLVVEGNGSIDQIGRAAIWDGSIPNCVHQNHLIRVRPGDRLLPDFLGYVWNAPSTIAQLKAVASSTSGLHTLSTAKVKSVQLRLPSLEIQTKLVAEAQRRLSLIESAARTVSASESRCAKLRGSLLATAFAGQLVSQNSTDEPASCVMVKGECEAREKSASRRVRRKVAA